MDKFFYALFWKGAFQVSNTIENEFANPRINIHD